MNCSKEEQAHYQGRSEHMVNKNELKSVMVRYGDTMTDLGKYLGMTYTNVSKKLNGYSDWTVSQVYAVKQRYNLTAEDIDRIFFRHECS